MTHILSLAKRVTGGNAVDSHRAYAAAHGYTFEGIGMLHISQERMRTMFSWHAIAAALDALAENALLIVLDDDAIVYQPHDIESFMENRAHFIMARIESDIHANCSAMCFRNTQDNRSIIGEIILALAEWLIPFSPTYEVLAGEIIARHFKPQRALLTADNAIFFNLQIASCQASLLHELDRIPTLFASEPLLILSKDEVWQEYSMNDHSFLDFAMDKRDGRNGTQFAETDREDIVVNASAPLQFVSLNTADIENFARFHEEDMVKYCQRHGYGYTSYRKIPAFVPERHGPSWAKPFLIRHHLATAETLVWVDADIRVGNFSLAIEDIIGPHDICVARDHTLFHFNSGVMAFRRSEISSAVIDDVCATIDAVADTAGVYFILLITAR